VKLQVEEDRETAVPQLVDDRVSLSKVKLEANFEPAAKSVETVGESKGGSGAGEVEGDDEAGIHL
jgi:hypothetical protein